MKHHSSESSHFDVSSFLAGRLSHGAHVASLSAVLGYVMNAQICPTNLLGLYTCAGCAPPLLLHPTNTISPTSLLTQPNTPLTVLRL